MEKTIYTKQSGRFALPQFQMLGVVLLIIGMVYAFQLNPVSILLLFIGIPLATLTTGVQIDFKRKKHRNYIRILGFKRGRWVSIPAIDYVTVFVENYLQNMGVASISKTDKYKDYKISLIVNKTQRFDAGAYNNKQQAFEIAEKLAKELRVRLLDYTSKEPRWIIDY